MVLAVYPQYRNIFQGSSNESSSVYVIGDGGVV
jgi:hypothetical protein